MCYSLKTDKILLNYFAYSKKTSISMTGLSNLAEKIVEKCNNGILATIDRDTIDHAVSRFSDVLKLADDQIVLIEKENFYIKNIEIINDDIPQFVKSKCIRECEALI